MEYSQKKSTKKVCSVNSEPRRSPADDHGTSPSTSAVVRVLAELDALEDAKIRAVNERHGDDHGVNLTKLRAVAKQLGRDEELAWELWQTGVTTARLVAHLVFTPRMLSATQLDAMLREARVPKVHDWLVNYHAKKSSAALTLRSQWIADADPVVASAGWALTADRVMRHASTIEEGGDPSGIDLSALLNSIEAEMQHAPERLQWAMNECLAQIGIASGTQRSRALEIGERLGVLRDYPTPSGCTSPFAPIWITEIVRRNAAKS